MAACTWNVHNFCVLFFSPHFSSNWLLVWHEPVKYSVTVINSFTRLQVVLEFTVSSITKALQLRAITLAVCLLERLTSSLISYEDDKKFDAASRETAVNRTDFIMSTTEEYAWKIIHNLWAAEYWESSQSWLRLSPPSSPGSGVKAMQKKDKRFQCVKVAYFINRACLCYWPVCLSRLFGHEVRLVQLRLCSFFIARRYDRTPARVISQGEVHLQTHFWFLARQV